MENETVKANGGPLLVFVDEVEIGRTTNRIKKQLIPALHKVKGEFDRLNIGKLTDDYLIDMVSGEMNKVRLSVLSSLQEGRPAIMDYNAGDEAARIMSRLADAIDWLKDIVFCNSYLECYIDYVTVDQSGDIVMADDAITAIRKANSTFAVSPKAKELFAAHKAAADSLNRFMNMMKGSIADLDGLFETSADGTISPAYVDYDMTAYAKG